jgi:DNA-directed RNA polymerase subunit F
MELASIQRESAQALASKSETLEIIAYKLIDLNPKNQTVLRVLHIGAQLEMLDESLDSL